MQKCSERIRLWFLLNKKFIIIIPILYYVSQYHTKNLIGIVIFILLSYNNMILIIKKNNWITDIYIKYLINYLKIDRNKVKVILRMYDQFGKLEIKNFNERYFIYIKLLFL